MGQRLVLHELLIATSGLADDHVYFQPPAGHKLDYPCIVYNRDFADTKFADNKPYKHMKRYVVTVMDRAPDSDIPDKIAALPTCVFDRWFAADRVNHDVYKLFF